MIACKQVSETAHALHLNIFEQPVCIDFFNILLEHVTFFCSHEIEAFVVSPELDEGSNHERLVLLACIRSTLRRAQGERIQC